MSNNLAIDPLDLSLFTVSPTTVNPGFTDDLNQIVGDVGSPADGFDAVFTEAVDLVTALDAILAALDADLDALLALAGNTAPGKLDTSMAGYASAFDAGATIVATGNALVPPGLLELPLIPGFGGAIFTPPVQHSADLGTLHLGDTPVGLRSWVFIVGIPNYPGAPLVQLVNGDTDVYQLVDTITRVKETEKGTAEDHTMTFSVVPVKLGTFVAQLNTIDLNAGGFTVTTYTVTIVP